ncbi:ATP-binding protein [Streptomyces sp. ISL-98]|uniref:ATP-binding protein n=1 Tax=Streptomyces sp. ISL-98 TaxID=2819192 RepID=UPI001BE724E2|nr:ATP-binding protein [Streptomyces sp. ISL-98]MBT2510185.1 ATP-binding protein [Streptomyces sp. ISL-98]
MVPLSKRRLVFASTTPQALRDRCLMAPVDDPDLTLGQLLEEFPALSLTELVDDHLRLPLSRVLIDVLDHPPAPGTPLYLPPGVPLGALSGGAADDEPAGAGEASAPDPVQKPQDRTVAPANGHPKRLSEREAVLIAHDVEISRAAAYLESGLSVLIRCEKLLVEHLAAEIAGRSGRPQQTVRLAESLTDAAAPGGFGPGRRAELLALLHTAVTDAPPEDVVVVPHLDLLAGGSDAALTAEARELTDVLYERSERVLLAFTDPSLVVPEVLAGRFGVRLALDILPREVVTADSERVPLGQALITEAEAELFSGFDPAGLYKYVAGMNAVRLRHAVRFAYHHHTAPDGDQESGRRPTFADLLQELRIFKARTSSAFEVPDVPLSAIGGYKEVKDELQRALDIVGGAADLPEHLRHDLVPRGFIFHGPPGTGKTLFAKAVASKLGATILVVSGPEITDMYVGESERKVRDLFAEARRNAPAVIVFDEFDSIAAQRTGRDDGGSRAGNAVVAQLLTELDGFRPEVPVLIIGTTNRIDLIDDALLRPSRFRPIKIDLPDHSARTAIAEVHAKHFGVAVRPGLLKRIATATDGMNGDEIRSVFRDARAEQLVGGRGVPGARRLGELVGELRRARQQRDLDRAQQQTGRSAAANAAQRSQRAAMIVLAGRQSARTAPAGAASLDRGDGTTP